MNTTLEVTLVKKSGGQSDLHFDNFYVGCKIVEWGVIFEGIHASGLKSEFKKCVHHTGGHLGKVYIYYDPKYESGNLKPLK